MKRFLLLLLFIPLLSFGQMMDKKVARIAKKNIEIFLNDDFNNNNSFLVSVDKGNRKVEDKSQGIGNQLSKSLSIMGAKVVNDGNGNVIKMSIKWAALDELKRLSATIFDSNSNSVVGSIEYNGPYIPNSHKNITAAIAYKLVTESNKRKGNSVSSNQKENTVETPPQIQNNKKKAIDDLKELKELLDLELITQDEFDKKSKELKKIILGN
tara:strand:+ start:120 stop:752 length:633 start_codon:yes stop_codon:yes gene_type:complete